MPGIVDADTHIIEHPGIWEHFDSDMYHRRPLLAAVTPMKEGQNRDFVWMINGNAVPKRFGKGSYAVAVGGSDSENNRTDIRNEVRYITNPKARVEDMDKRGVDIEVVFPPSSSRTSPTTWTSKSPSAEATTATWPTHGVRLETVCDGSSCPSP